MGKGKDKLWELESRLPDSVKRHTDRVIRTGAKLAKRLHPLGEDTRRKGEAWVKAHNPLTKKKRR